MATDFAENICAFLIINFSLDFSSIAALQSNISFSLAVLKSKLLELLVQKE